MKKNSSADAFIKQLVAGKTPEEIAGKGGLLEQLTKRVYEAALEGELSHHLGYEKNDPKGDNSGNSRNGYSSKNLKTESCEVQLDVPRDRNGTFQPQLVEKGQRRSQIFDEQIISLYSKGMTTRMIQQHLKELYRIDVSPSLISTVTDSVMEDVIEWQNRKLERLYPILFLDGMRVKVRQDGRVINKVAYQALAIDGDGHKDILGIWLQETEGANFWLMVLTELRNRGVEDVLIVCVDGLSGLPEAIEAIYPQAQVQQCIIHMIRSSTKYVVHKDKKELCGDLKEIYTAATEELAEANLDKFAQKWDVKYPIIAKSWRRRWGHLSVYFEYPPEVRRLLYTTNTIESVNRVLRKSVKTRSVFPGDEAVRKVFYLTILHLSKKWRHTKVSHWSKAAAMFVIKYPDRFPDPFTQKN